MTNYSRGYNLEWKVKQMLEGAGLMVLRSPASKSALDLIALTKSSKLFIQCKKTKKDALYIYGLQELIQTAEKYGAKPLLAYSLRFTPIYVKEITQDNYILKRDGKNQKLEEYIQHYLE